MKNKISSTEDLLLCGKLLENKTMKEIIDEYKIIKKFKKTDKGKIGKLIEEYFGIEENTDFDPDFSNLGIELKTNPLKRNKTGRFVVKERLIITLLNYRGIIENDNITKTKLWKKSNKVLVVWYLYEKDWKKSQIIEVSLINLETNPKIMKILESDYQIIREKILAGGVHKLSEGDTKYLGSIRSGSERGKPKHIQPFSKIKTYQRALVFKQAFMEQIFSNDLNDNFEILYETNLEDLITNFVSPYKNKNLKDLFKNFKINNNDQNKELKLFFKILNVSNQEQFNKKYGTKINFNSIIFDQDKNFFHDFKIKLPLTKEKGINWLNSKLFQEIEEWNYLLVFTQDSSNANNLILMGIGRLIIEDSLVYQIRKLYDDENYKFDSKKVYLETIEKNKFIHIKGDYLFEFIKIIL